MPTNILVEACVDAIDAALEAERGGAGRLELCGELLQGGVTPSGGLIGAVRQRVKIPLFVLIRPQRAQVSDAWLALDESRTPDASEASTASIGLTRAMYKKRW